MGSCFATSWTRSHCIFSAEFKILFLSKVFRDFSLPLLTKTLHSLTRARHHTRNTRKYACGKRWTSNARRWKAWLRHLVNHSRPASFWGDENLCFPGFGAAAGSWKITKHSRGCVTSAKAVHDHSNIFNFQLHPTDPKISSCQCRSLSRAASPACTAWSCIPTRVPKVPGTWLALGVAARHREGRGQDGPWTTLPLLLCHQLLVKIRQIFCKIGRKGLDWSL